MKILFVSHKWPAQTGESCARALAQLGHRVVLSWARVEPVSFCGRFYVLLKRTHYTGKFFSKAELTLLNRIVLRKAFSLSPDLIVVNAGGEVSPETIQSIRARLSSKIVCWAGDDPNSYTLGPYYLRSAKYYDKYFIIDPTWYSKKLKDAGVKKCSILQYGVDPEIYKPLQLSELLKVQYGADISHVGAPHADRLAILSQIADYKLALWGATSTKILRSFSRLPTPLLPHVRGGVVPAPVCNLIYNASKISLNIQHPQVKSTCSNKTFEIAGGRNFLLTNYEDPAHSLYDQDELVSFQSTSHLRDLIDYYLKNEDERRRIAERAYKRTVSQHLYIHRMKRLLEEAGF